jgi:hypothetical protein
MHMKPKRLWILVGGLFLVWTALEITLVGIPRAKNLGTALTNSSILFLGFTIVTIAPVVALGALLALIPFRKWAYLAKFKTTIPAMFALAMLFWNGFALQQLYYKFAKGSYREYAQKYEDIEVPSGLDCASIRNGVFLLGDHVIERQGNYQTETASTGGEKSEYEVEWINDCEYHLTPYLSQKHQVAVKVDYITAEGYGCFVFNTYGLDNDPRHMFVKFKR